MQKKSGFAGVIAPVLTPFGEHGGPDTERFVAHCEWLLQEGCTGLAPFGTTSEGNSLGIDEKMELLEELVDADIDPKLLMPGTGSCSVADTIIMTEQALELGIVDRVFPEESLQAEVQKYAQRLAIGPTMAQGYIKLSVNTGLETGLAEGLAIERAHQNQLFASEDAAEGLKAFLEKRPPKYQGR